MDLFALDDAYLDSLDAPEKRQDGIYRPDLKKAPDGNYQATLRFLPNYGTDGKVGDPAIMKHLHYADMKSDPDLSGYYDCQKNISSRCDICTAYWKLNNSESTVEKAKAKRINRSTKWYSYVLVIEDKQAPENNGQILIWPYGKKIKEKILQQKEGVIGMSGQNEKTNIFDLGTGKDFNLVIRKVGGFPNYDSSTFHPAQTPLGIPGAGRIPTTTTKDGRVTIEPKAQNKVKEFLLSRKIELNQWQPAEWTSEETVKVQKIINLLTVGEEQAHRMINNPKSSHLHEDASDFLEKANTATSSAKTSAPTNFWDDGFEEDDE